MDTPPDLQNSLNTLSTFHPLLDILVWTLWLYLTYRIWRGLFAAVFGNDQVRLAGWERARYRALQEQIDAGILIPKDKV